VIRETTLFERFEIEDDAALRVWDSCITMFISPGLPEGAGTEPPSAVELPSLSTIAQLAFCQAAAESIVESTTLDAPSGVRGRLRPRSEFRLLEDTQMFLRCLASGIKPGVPLGHAWDEFFRLYDPLVRSAVRARGMCWADAEDCVQEVWTAIVTRLPQFEPDPAKGRFRCWIARLIHSRVVDFVRKENRRAARQVALPEEIPSQCDLDPAAAYYRAQRRRLVRHVLGHLEQQVSQTNYRLIHLRWIEERAVGDVADALGLASEQVWYRHHRVKRRLHVLLEAHRGGWS